MEKQVNSLGVPLWVGLGVNGNTMKLCYHPSGLIPNAKSTASMMNEKTSNQLSVLTVISHWTQLET